IGYRARHYVKSPNLPTSTNRRPQRKGPPRGVRHLSRPSHKTPASSGCHRQYPSSRPTPEVAALERRVGGLAGDCRIGQGPWPVYGARGSKYGSAVWLDVGGAAVLRRLCSGGGSI